MGRGCEGRVMNNAYTPKRVWCGVCGQKKVPIMKNQKLAPHIDPKTGVRCTGQ